jgi:FkbM family methyltransferase
MKKIILVKSIKKNLLHPFNILINHYNHWLAKNHLKNYPQVAIFSFDHIGLRINLEGRYENRDLFLIRDYLKSVIPYPYNSTALDIGANIGNHSVYFSDFFEGVFAFEPNPRTFALLKFNSDYSCLRSNIKCFNFGLSDQNGHLFFKSSQSNIGGSAIVSEISKIANESVFLIDVKRADEIEELFERDISLIKIDIEGHELQALKGARELIKKNKPIILFEQHEDEFINGTSNVVDYLNELNYKFLTIEESFYFGDSFFLEFLGLILRSIFGYKLLLTEREYFHKRSYDMIVAVPN